FPALSLVASSARGPTWHMRGTLKTAAKKEQRNYEHKKRLEVSCLFQLCSDVLRCPDVCGKRRMWTKAAVRSLPSDRSCDIQVGSGFRRRREGGSVGSQQRIDRRSVAGHDFRERTGGRAGV